MGMLMHRHKSYRERHKAQAEPEPPAPAEAAPAEEKQLADMLVAELREVAAAEGVDLTGLKKKDEFRAAIEAARKAAAEAAQEPQEPQGSQGDGDDGGGDTPASDDGPAGQDQTQTQE